ncbi:MAG: class I tRNA ligase family protein, partial [Chitinophagaceae bacterium]|nr:class I tRNA ligase family protein [Chitinophagaceae bacterium]
QYDTFPLIWFQSRLWEVKIEVNGLMDQFRLSEALKTVYSLIWDDFCSWFLEWVKPGFEQGIHPEVYYKTIDFFEDLMQLLHPFTPFITEEIYHLLREQKDDLCVKQFVTPGSPDPETAGIGEALKQSITSIRDARNKNHIKPKEQVKLFIQTATESSYRIIENIFRKQVNAAFISYVTEPVLNTVAVVSGKDKYYIETEQPLNVEVQKEDLLKELQHLKGFLASVEKKLGNEKFVQNAKPDVLALERKKKADAEEKIRVIEGSL